MDTLPSTPYEPYPGDTILWRLIYAGRNDAPLILFNGLVSGEIRWTKSDLHDLVAVIWSSAEYPQGTYANIWIRLFETADYPKPSAPLTIYRGTTAASIRRMSWTTDQATAQWFAERLTGSTGQPSFVYHTIIDPSGVLAKIDELDPSGRRESEIVVNPESLGIISPLHG